MAQIRESIPDKPPSVLQLEKVFGGPSQAAFGSAVLYDSAASGEDLEQAAIAKYKYFVGDSWERFREENWLGTWHLTYSRGANTTHDIVAELKSINDFQAKMSVSLLIDNDNYLKQAALKMAFDDSEVNDFRVYGIGDGEAMSGLLMAARRNDEGSLFLVFLMD